MSSDWQALFELGVAAYYRGELDIGQRACEWLLSQDGLPFPVHEQTSRNQVFYAPLLTEITDAVIYPLEFPVPEPWTRFNPSIAADESGFTVVVRSANYDIDQGRYRLLDSGGTIRTQNYLLKLDDDLSVRESRRLDDVRAREAAHPSPVQGFEDCRLFRYRDSWWATATTREHNPSGISQIALLPIDGAGVGEPVLLAGPDPNRHEKNWVPLSGADGLSFIYSFQPTVVLRYSDEERLEEISRAPAPGIAGSFRGGSQAVQVEDGVLCIVHESVIFEDGARVYPHRFVLLDRTFRITHISRQFFFLARTVEFCAGLALRNDRVLASFGFEDREAYVASMPLSAALATLRPVSHPQMHRPSPVVGGVASGVQQHARPESDPPATGPAAGLTLVTCLFDLAGREGSGRKGVEFYREHSPLVLGMKLPLVLYAEPDLVDWASSLRRSLGLHHLTEIIPRTFEDLPLHHLAAHLSGVPTFRNHDPLKDTPLYQLLSWSKFDLVAESILRSRFRTDHYAWIDFGLGHVATAPDSLPKATELVSILEMRAVSPADTRDRRAFYEFERGRLAGGFFGGRVEVLLELRREFLTELGEALAVSIRPNDQMILSYLSVKRSDLFEPYYGNYASILTNQNGIKGDIPTVLRNLAHCHREGLWLNAFRICEGLLASLEGGSVTLSAEERAQVLDAYLVAASNRRRPELDHC